MAFVIEIRGASSTAENAAILTHLNTMIASLHGSLAHKVDCGGTVIGATRFTGGDEASPHGVKQGDQW